MRIADANSLAAPMFRARSATSSRFNSPYSCAMRFRLETRNFILFAKASLDDSAKKEENKLMQKVQDWKVFQLYREKMQKLKSQLNSFSADAQNALSKVWSGVKEAQTQEQLEKAEEENSRFQASTQPQVKAFANELKEAANLKRIMLVKKEGDEIDSKLQNSYLPEEHLNELKDAVNTF